MNLTVEYSKPEIKNAFEWQLSQEINLKDEHNNIVAKAEIELLTLNKHRGADESYELLIQQGATDWEIPLNLYFKKQNIINELAEKLAIKSDSKAKTHILIEAFSVLPNHRNQGIAKTLLKAITEQHTKAQSISLLSMPMALFLDAEDCESEESKQYYQDLAIEKDTLTRSELRDVFKKLGFLAIDIDDSQLAEPLAFDIFIANPTSLQ